MRKKVSSIVLNVFLLLLGIVTVYPFIWMLCSSFKQNKEIMALQQHLLPQEFTIDNYISMNSHFNFMRFFWKQFVYHDCCNPACGIYQYNLWFCIKQI